MSSSAHYVTQTSIYDCPKLGRLTDRRIEHYRKRGYYSTGFADEHRALQAKKHAKNKTRAQLVKAALADLLKDFLP